MSRSLKPYLPNEREVIFFQHAEHIARLNGLHTTAVDLNTTSTDMGSVWTRLNEMGVPQYVACQPPEPPYNGTGDPSQNTGLGVWSAALTTLDFLGIKAEEAAFLVQGVGGVGGPQTVVMGMTHPDITTIILDKDQDRITDTLKNYPGNHIFVGNVEDPFGDETVTHSSGKPLIFMPTAREGEVNLKRLEQMVKAKVVVVCGAANNQFPFTSHYRPDLRVAWDYEFAGITVVPDSGNNAGGIQHLEMVKLGMPEAIIGDLIVRGEQLFTRDLLERAQLAKEPPMVTYQKLVVDVVTDYCLEHNITP